MSDYQRISCEAHSLYELAIMRNQLMQVIIDRNIQTIRPKDIITKVGIEYLVYIDKNDVLQELRADKITL